MLNGDLYPKGKRVLHKGWMVSVEYVCHAGCGVHIVLVPPLDTMDDRVREVPAEELIEIVVPEFKEPTDEFLAWVRANQVKLMATYHETIGRLLEQGYLPMTLAGKHCDSGFVFFAIIAYESNQLRRSFRGPRFSYTHQ